MFVSLPNAQTLPYSPLGVFPTGEGSPSVNISLHKDYPWNPSGSGFANQDVPFVFARVTDKDTIQQVSVWSGTELKLREKAQYNVAHSLSHPFFVEINKCSHTVVVMRSYMGPEQMDSPRCLEKGNCVPVGGHSVWSRSSKSGQSSRSSKSDQSSRSLESNKNSLSSKSDKSITIVATSLDGIGEFYGDASDALGTGVTLAVTLSVAETLANITSQFPDSELVFAFFQGEWWGRVGSRAFLRDVKHFACANRLNATVSPFNDAMCASPLKVALMSSTHA